MPAFLILYLCFAELLLFLLPGLAAVSIVSRKWAFSKTQALIATIAASAALGYFAFWIYFGNKTAGQVFSYGLIAASLATIWQAYRRKRSVFFLQPDFYIPLAYAFCLGVFCLSLLYLFVNPVRAGVDVANVRFFPEIRPGDNIIPFIFAQRIYDRAPIRPFCCGDWLSSDRPPLQAGIFLMQRPVLVGGNTSLQYQVLGTMLQCLWVCGVWSFLRALGATQLRVAQAIGLLAFSGFLFYNSVYVWPKLLAATFMLFVFAIICPAAIQRRALSRLEVVLSSSCFVLALLAHPGSVFSVPAIAVILMLRRNLLTVKHAAPAMLIIVGAIVPWTLYQKFYDPPGDRLFKMHLAGVIEPDSRGAFEAIRDAYSGVSGKTILENKWQNMKTLFGAGALSGSARVAEREYVPRAIGLLNFFGWIAWCVAQMLRRRAKLPSANAMICAALLNLLVWCLVLFGPGQAFTEHGSYADILLLSLGLAAFLMTLHRAVVVATMALQAFSLLFVWVSYRPNAFILPSRMVVGPALQWPMLILAVCFGAVLFLAAALPHALFQEQAE